MTLERSKHRNFLALVQGSKLWPIRLPMRLAFPPWRLKLSFSLHFGDLNFAWFRCTIKHLSWNKHLIWSSFAFIVKWWAKLHIKIHIPSKPTSVRNIFCDASFSLGTTVTAGAEFCKKTAEWKWLTFAWFRVNTCDIVNQQHCKFSGLFTKF